MGDVLHQIKKDLSNFVQNGKTADIKTMLSSNILEENANIQSSRPVLLYLGELLYQQVLLCLAENPAQPCSIEEEDLVSLLNFILSKVASHPMKSQFDETDSLCRESLFKYHVACGEYKIGASILGETQLDSTLCKYNSEKKADILVRCSEAFLQEDDSTSAETLLMRARQYMADVMESSSTDVPSADSEASSTTILKLRYRVIKAKCDDSNRKFVDAARQYYELSNTSNSTIPLDEKLELLGNAGM